MSGITGKEIHQFLVKACEVTGLSPATTSRLLLNFTLAWGDSIMTDIDRAMFAEMTAGHVPSQEAADMFAEMLERDRRQEGS